MKKICALFVVLCLIFSLTGCGQEKDSPLAESFPRESYSGVVTARFTEGSGSDARDCLQVDTGESGSMTFALTNGTEISGADDISVSDRVDIECEGSGDTDYRSIIKATVQKTESAPVLMVMVNGALYYDTGRESTLDARCGAMDGEITSAVGETEIPAENDQSNFGAGYGYQYGERGTIEIYRNGSWYVFAQKLVDYTFEDSERGVKFSIAYPEGWKLSELRASDGSESRDADPSTGIGFHFGGEEEQFNILAMLFMPYEVDETLFEAEAFETSGGLSGTRYTRILDGRAYAYYIFGGGETLPQYMAAVTMSAANYLMMQNDVEAVMKTLAVAAD